MDEPIEQPAQKPAAFEAEYGAPVQPAHAEAPPTREDILRGLIFAFGGVIVGAAATVGIWRLGFIASITSFVLAALATYLYSKGAGTPPRKGLVPLVLLIVLGVAASFFAVVGSDAWVAYDDLKFAGAESRMSFVRRAMTDGDVLSSYGKDMAMFFVFAALGVFSTLRRLVSPQQS